MQFGAQRSSLMASILNEISVLHVDFVIHEALQVERNALPFSSLTTFSSLNEALARESTKDEVDLPRWKWKRPR